MNPFEPNKPIWNILALLCLISHFKQWAINEPFCATNAFLNQINSFEIKLINRFEPNVHLSLMSSFDPTFDEPMNSFEYREPYWINELYLSLLGFFEPNEPFWA